MNEKEKMLHGENYNAEEKELKKDRRHARQVCFEYNNTPPADAEKMQKIMSSLLGKHGKNCGIRAPFYCDYGYNIEVGDNFFANFNLTILDGAKVTIGNNVFIALTWEFIRQDIRLMRNGAEAEKNMQNRSASEMTYGLEPAFPFCRASKSAITALSAPEASSIKTSLTIP